AVDTNILIYAHRRAAPEHQAATHAINEAAGSRSGWGIAVASIGEFWAVVTHPSSKGGASTPAQAAGFLASLVHEAEMKVWVPPHGFDRRLIQIAKERDVRGSLVFDLQIALTAIHAGARELWTRD